jgi:amphi-Trp domain-containing protein
LQAQAVQACFTRSDQASANDVVIEREDMRFVAHVPDQVHLEVEFEIEDDGSELEIELTW